MKKPITQEERGHRRRLRDALNEIELLIGENPLLYMHEEGPVNIEWRSGRLVSMLNPAFTSSRV